MIKMEMEMFDLIEKLKIDNLKQEMIFKMQSLNRREAKVPSKDISNNKISLGWTTVLVAIIGLLATSLGTALQGYFSTKLKRQEFEFDLISKAIENGDSIISRKNLKFLLDIGFVADKEGNIKKMISDTSYVLPEFLKSSPISFVYRTPFGKKYHIPSCRMVKNGAIKLAIKEAEDLGLNPCAICIGGDLNSDSVNEIQCSALTKAGNRCKHFTKIENGFCFLHQSN